jgi:hypothetical protein
MICKTDGETDDLGNYQDFAGEDYEKLSEKQEITGDCYNYSGRPHKTIRRLRLPTGEEPG